MLNTIRERVALFATVLTTALFAGLALSPSASATPAPDGVVTDGLDAFQSTFSNNAPAVITAVVAIISVLAIAAYMINRGRKAVSGS